MNKQWNICKPKRKMHQTAFLALGQFEFFFLLLVCCLFVACDDQESQISMSKQSDMLIETDMTPEADMIPEADMVTEADMMPEADMTPEADMMPAVDMMPEVDMMLGPPACANGMDDDQDELIDYPRDPGCSSVLDNDEEDPELFACQDELDNDEDGLIDLDDPGCSTPEDNSEVSVCGPHQALDVSYSTRVVTDSEGESAFFEACRSNNAPEQTFLFTLRRPVEYLYFSTEGSALDTLLSVRRDCEDISSELACNDDGGGVGMTYSAVQLDQPALGDYYIIVDGYGESAGRVVLNIEAGVAEGEACPEEGSPLVCPRGQACNYAGVCAPAECADSEDNDGDDRTDYPSDPGCDSPEDQDEQDPADLPECADSEDNDTDGLSDFPNDPDCDSASDQREGPDPDCSDRQDNDRDGLIDFPDDPGCEAIDDNNEYNAPACDDGIDNDADGQIDFPNDAGCVNADDESERTPRNPPQCADGIDNDGDGLIDFPEDALSCQYAADTSEDNPCERREFREVTGLSSARGTQDSEPNDFAGSCGGDEFGESLVVWRVSETRPLESLRVTTRNSEALVTLYAKNSCEASEELFCRVSPGAQGVSIGPRAAGEDIYFFVDARFFSGIWRLQFDAKLAEGARCDNEGIPGERWQCADDLSCVETISGFSQCVRPQCNDGNDNDADGLIDYPYDPGCVSPETNSELDPEPLPACANNIDEDRDGLFDFGEDPNCDSAADNFEGPECQDNTDNDGDGLVDTQDPQCVCANSESESVVAPACSDACDNDGDGLIDAEDPGCDTPSDMDEFNELQCRDDLDNDEDGLTDYPDDPGCTSPVDDDETTPSPAPECGDGIDNDQDGLIDFNQDEGCSSASDQSEVGSCDLSPLTVDDNGQASGNTIMMTNSQSGSCGFGLAPEAVYYLNLPHPVNLSASTLGSNFNTVLYVRSECRALTSCDPSDEGCTPSSTEIGCNQDGPSDLTSLVTLDAVSGDLFLFVDGLGIQSGDYQLSVQGNYLENGRCDPNGPSFLTCPDGSQCQVVATDQEQSEWQCQATP